MLTDLGSGDFHVEYIYEDIQDAYVGGDHAIAGYTDGAGTVFELEGSGNDTFMEDNYPTNDFDNNDPAGTFSFSVVGGTPNPLAGPPCYAPGTLIDTPSGTRAIETLAMGDMVNTLDHGAQPIRWTRRGELPLEDADTDDKPVLIRADALGKGLPVQDLIVSPQHRILVGDGGQLTRHFDKAAFAPAKALTRLPGIRHMKGKAKITWIHFACDRHEVVTANGCLSESLLLGPMVVKGLPLAERQTLKRIFGMAARPTEALKALRPAPV